MRIVTLIAAAATLLLGTQVAYAEAALPAGATAREARLLEQVGPQTRAWIKEEAARQAALGTPSEAGAMRAVQSSPAFGYLGDADVMAVAFLVLMETSRSAREDVKAIMAGVEQANRSKAATRAAIQHSGANVARAASQPGLVGLPRSGPALESITEAGALPAGTKVTLDGARGDAAALNELEEQSLRLQMAMDRQSKITTTLSNLLKKMSDAGATITQNLK